MSDEVKQAAVEVAKEIATGVYQHPIMTTVSLFFVNLAAFYVKYGSPIADALISIGSVYIIYLIVQNKRMTHQKIKIDKQISEAILKKENTTTYKSNN